jgi:subtilisin family serine protease
MNLFNTSVGFHRSLKVIMSSLILFTASVTVQAEKTKIETAADLPRVEFDLKAKPSEILIKRGALLESLMSKVEADATDLLENYEITDGSTRSGLLDSLYTIAFLNKDWKRVLDLGDQVREARNKHVDQLLSNRSTDAWARAAMETGGEDSEAFRKVLANEYLKSLEKLPFKVVEDSLQASVGQLELVTADLIKGQVAASFDPNAEARQLVVDRGFASGILSVVRTTELVPHMDVLASTVRQYLEANAEEKIDRWSKRLIDLNDLKDLTPVVTTVWDSGTDISMFPKQRWINEAEVENDADDDENGFSDDISGIAFDVNNQPSSGSLMTLPEGDLEDLNSSLDWIVGSMDLQANIDSEEARKFRELVRSLSPDEVQPFMLKVGRLGLYTHGTMTAFTTVEDNPAARLMYVRFTFDVKPVPDPFDEAYADSFVEYIDTVFAYLKNAGSRVVNMSWRVTTPMIEGSLASIEPDTEKRRERALKIYDKMSGAMEQAIQSAPEILFIAGAGNEDEDVDFVKSFPAGLDLPNLITVGAVDITLQPASFTSFGKSIDLYANGFEVNTRMPGGKKTMISGTSLAAPMVSNLASKLLAVDPSLSVKHVRELIESTATEEGEQKIRVIHPKAALAALKDD